MTTRAEKYKWVDITDELDREAVTLTDRQTPATQTKYQDELIFTLVDTALGVKKLIPSRHMREGRYRVVVDYATDPEYGVGAVYQKRPVVEWTDVTGECVVRLCKSNQSHGYYVKILHDGVVIALLGLKGSIKPYKTPKDYKTEMVEGAHVSFKVFKKTAC